MLQEAIKALTANLRASLESTANILHKLEKGELRETQIREAFLPHLPKQYRLASGIVVNPKSEQSKQQDFLVVDAIGGMPFISAGDSGVFPVEVVAASIEIKSVLDTTAMKTAVKNIASVKSLMPEIQRARMVDEGNVLAARSTTSKLYGAVIGLSTQTKLDVLQKTFLEECSNVESANRPNSVLIMDEGVFFWSVEGGLIIEQSPKAAKKLLLITSDKQENITLLFYAALIEFLRMYTFPPLKILDYVNATSMEIKIHETNLD